MSTVGLQVLRIHISEQHPYSNDLKAAVDDFMSHAILPRLSSIGLWGLQCSSGTVARFLRVQSKTLKEINFGPSIGKSFSDLDLDILCGDNIKTFFPKLQVLTARWDWARGILRSMRNSGVLHPALKSLSSLHINAWNIDEAVRLLSWVPELNHLSLDPMTLGESENLRRLAVVAPNLESIYIAINLVLDGPRTPSSRGLPSPTIPLVSP